MSQRWSRRQFLEAASASLLALAVPWGPAAALAFRHPRPAEAGWPGPSEWAKLKARVQGRLVQPVSPVKDCVESPGSEACRAALENVRNPFWLEEQPGATQSTGWAGAWEAAPSVYAVAAESSEDVAAAVDFAREHGLRLVVKGTGHDYLGRSCAPDSLLVWTHRMRKVTVHERFVPRGAPESAGLPAVSAEAGARWLEVYGEVTTRHGRYAQGGGCASVGAAGGFPQGGGYGSFSKKFGTGAAGMVEVEVVTSDGRVLVANAHQHPDLFWALRGGGAGTFGIVTRITLMTHELPSTFGLVRGRIRAISDEAYQALVERFCRFYCEALNNEHWGEQFSFKPDNSMDLYMTFQGLDLAQVEAIWAPLRDWLDREGYAVEWDPFVLPARHMWDLAWWRAHHPDMVTPDPRNPGHYWWAGNQNEVSMYWYTYQSRYIPLASLQDPAFAGVLFQASRHWTVSMHMNKGLSGASEDALRRGRETSVNPAAEKAAGLAILAAGEAGLFPGVPGHEPDPAVASEKIGKVGAAMKLIREATPGAGSYANEADFFEEHWQEAFWGTNYPRLLEIKRRYDPAGLFHTHHGVGSEGWSRDQMTRS